MDLNLQLKEIIEARGITQAYICKNTGMTPDSVSRILRGRGIACYL